METKIYIQSAMAISPQETFLGPAFLETKTIHEGNQLKAIEPDYKSLIDVKLIRRMSRIIKMGFTTAIQCLKEAAVEMPDAIIVGTAYGCLEDTNTFLSKMVEQKEELLTPTAFIQSTHNTVGAQIALMIHCHNYNNTYTHRGFSFESALLDALLFINEKKDLNILVGGIDEITDSSHQILSRFGLYKKPPLSNQDLISTKSKGTMAGEGASFFLLTDQASEKNIACLEGVSTFYKPASNEQIEEEIQSFLRTKNISLDEIDLIINGRNGDMNHDNIFDRLDEGLFKNKNQIHYKDLCGEYPTSTAFALWLASSIFKHRSIPSIFPRATTIKNGFKKILIYNHYQNIHHSLLLVSAC
jgi:3-oxoacyl-[acyl-carrier-protein] synthase II